MQHRRPCWLALIPRVIGLVLCFTDANDRVLAEHGLPPHQEPEALPPPGVRAARVAPLRLVAVLRPGHRLRPAREGEDPAKDRRLDRERSVAMDSHVICHSDSEGFYV